MATATRFQTNLLDVTYHGWTNYKTWNVALYINNDEGVYNMIKNGDVCCYEDLLEVLKEQGIDCARRTVAKYREALKIAPANLRKTL